MNGGVLRQAAGADAAIATARKTHRAAQAVQGRSEDRPTAKIAQSHPPQEPRAERQESRRSSPAGQA